MVIINRICVGFVSILVVAWVAIIMGHMFFGTPQEKEFEYCGGCDCWAQASCYSFFNEDGTLKE